jgi:methyl-accepting chemotaxis protein
MYRSITNMPIFRRLLIAFALAAVVPGIVIVLLGTYYVNQFTVRGQAVKTAFNAQNTAYEEQINLQRMNALLQARHAEIFAGLGGSVQDPSMNASGQLINDDILARETDFDQTLAKYQQDFELATSPNMGDIRTILLSDDPTSTIIGDQQAILNTVMQRQWPAYKKLQDEELALLGPKTGKPSYLVVYKKLFDANAQFTDLRNSWQRVVNIAENMGEVVTTVGPSQVNPVVFGDVIAFLVTTVVVLFIGYIISVTITRPLGQLTTLTKRIARGETGARARIRGRDEIHMVANSMNNMLDNIVRLIQETQAQRDSLQAQVEKLVSEVSGVGEGDLRIQAEVTVDTLGVLADSFNYMVEELSSLIVRVKMVAHEVENSTVTILDHMTQLVENGDIQLQQIANATAGVEHIAGSSRHVAERAQVLYKIARETRMNAQSGRASMNQSLQGIERIHENVQDTASKVQLLGDRSREIDEIVAAISNIAHQTNRLALDAAIQAAMAGENGKGFGAVAADIRRLAERAKEEASTVTRIVRSIREDIGAVAVAMQDTEHETSVGAKLTQEAGTTLGSIFAAIDHEAEEIENISLMTTQQLQSSGAIVQIMQGVSDTTEQSSTSTRDASQNMERLARLVEQLRASVEAFKLREDQNYYAPTQFDITPIENEQNNQMTVSGIFRTVTGAAQPPNARSYNALPPAGPPPPYSPYPVAPYQPNGRQVAPQRSGQRN